jgi:hypothetical protein
LGFKQKEENSISLWYASWYNIMNNFTNNIRVILNNSIKGAKLTNMKKLLTISLMIGLLAGVSLAQSPIKYINQSNLAERQSELKGVSQPDLEATAVKSIVGTWELTITPDGLGAPSFSGLYSFMPGPDLFGGVALFSSVGPPIPGLGNPGHGVWIKTGTNTYVATVKQFTFTDVNTVDGLLVIKSNITLTGIDTFTSQDTVKIFDLAGNVIVTITGSEQARRMKVEFPFTVEFRRIN